MPVRITKDTTPCRTEPFRISSELPFTVMVPVTFEPLTLSVRVASLLVRRPPSTIVISPLQIPAGPAADIRTANTIKQTSGRMAILAP